jgi:hypothetical protein
MNLIVNIVLPLAILVSMNIRIYRTMKGQFWYKAKRDQVRIVRFKDGAKLIKLAPKGELSPLGLTPWGEILCSPLFFIKL